MYYYSHLLKRETERLNEILESDRLKTTKAVWHVYGITEAQNGWGSKGPLETIYSKPSAQEGPEQVIQDHDQLGFEHNQESRLYDLLRQPVLVFDNPHNKNLFCCAQM